jgi:hypothetical protein
MDADALDEIIPWNDPSAIEALADPEFKSYFSDSHKFSTPAPQKLMILSHSPAAMRGWCRFWWSTYRHSATERPLMERVRYLVADHIACSF